MSDDAKMFLIGALLILFVAIPPIITFGHCAANSKQKYIEDTVAGCILCAGAYPLYWSWKYFKGEQNEKN